MTSLFQVRDAGFAYPGRSPSIWGATFEVERGEHLVLLGMNGAGKSTLLHLLGGILFPTSGEVAFEDTPLTHEHIEHDAGFRRAFRTRVGILFQNPDTQLFCPTVRDEIAFGPLQCLPRAEALDRTAEMLAAFGLEALAGEAPYALSGGEKRRVALAAVLAMRPEVLLLDEPASNLDPKTCDFLFGILGQYAADPGRTVVVATHDLPVARALATRCLIVAPDHTVAACGGVEALLDDEDLLRRVNLVGERRWEGRR